jgi:hypothetical protein
MCRRASLFVPLALFVVAGVARAQGVSLTLDADLFFRNDLESCPRSPSPPRLLMP